MYWSYLLTFRAIAKKTQPARACSKFARLEIVIFYYIGYHYIGYYVRYILILLFF